MYLRRSLSSTLINMARTLCDWSRKDLEKNSEKLSYLVADAQFFCRNCARSANTKKVLCKPAALAIQFVGSSCDESWR